MIILQKVLTAIITIAVLAIFLAWPVQWLWNNCLIGAVDGVHSIGFGQALGINFLFGILFKQQNSNN